jgi:hypothetical protein
MYLYVLQELKEAQVRAETISLGLHSHVRYCYVEMSAEPRSPDNEGRCVPDNTSTKL